MSDLTTRQTADLMRLAKRNRWTLWYLSVVTTVMFILKIVDMWSNHA